MAVFDRDRTAGARFRQIIILCVLGVLLNLFGAVLAGIIHNKLYLDSLGTITVAIMGGYLPGIFVGLVTNLLKSINDPTAIYYGVISVLIAVVSAFFSRRGYLKKLPGIVAFVVVLSVIGGVFGFYLTWNLYEDAYYTDTARSLYREGGFSAFEAALFADYAIDLMDKIISVIIVVVLIRLIPGDVYDRLELTCWQQKPLTDEQRKMLKRSRCRTLSLRTRIVIIMLFSTIYITSVAAIISFVLYRDTTIDNHIRLGSGVADLAAAVIDPDKTDDYLAKGKRTKDYTAAEQKLYSVLFSSDEIQDIYIMEAGMDGFHVVFDLDRDNPDPEFIPGTVLPVPEHVVPYMDDLCAGKETGPVISDWVMTIFRPVCDEEGRCVCYVAAEISMDRLDFYMREYLAKLISLCTGFVILLLAGVMWFTEYNLILPINTMAAAAGACAFNTEAERTEGMEAIKALDIHTGDEIENLYTAFYKMSDDVDRYVTEVDEKNSMIAKMQDGLVMVLAEMVESRDKNTGQHVQKTASYVKIIMDVMKKEGIYTDSLSDDFVKEVVRSAPLHDIGKITIPDSILNKPGRLTDEEFSIMRTHTTAGSNIIKRAIDSVPESGYLKEAERLAAHHHERWDGKGYPDGLSGEDIPLSARIMAVADVFDALVSKRSYKEGFPFKKAIEIMREGIGSQFDPKVVRAFLHAENKVKKVAEEFGELSEEEK